MVEQRKAWWNNRWGTTGRRDLVCYAAPDGRQVLLARDGTDAQHTLRCWVLPDPATADQLAAHLMDDQDGWRAVTSVYSPLSFDPSQIRLDDLDLVLTDPATDPPSASE